MWPGKSIEFRSQIGIARELLAKFDSGRWRRPADSWEGE